MLISLGQVVGYTVQATDKPAGKVADVYVDDVVWTVRHVAVADAGGVGIHMAAVEPGDIAGVDAAAGELRVNRTHDDIAGGPDVTLDPPVVHHVNRENDPHLRSIDEVRGYKVTASDGEVGTLDDFLVDENGWKVGLVVVAGTDGRKRLVGPGLIDRLDFDAKTAHVELDRSRFAGSPVYDSARPIARLEDVALVGREAV